MLSGVGALELGVEPPQPAASATSKSGTAARNLNLT
jgi:hypothetical protein